MLLLFQNKNTSTNKMDHWDRPTGYWVVPVNKSFDVCGQFSGKLSNQFQSTQQEIYIINFVAFAKPYLADQPLKPSKWFKRLTLYRLTVLLNNFLSFSKGLTDWRTITKYSCLVRLNPSLWLHHDELQCHCYPIKAELERMEKLGEILKVTSPTEWCAGMVVVSKPNGTVSIYVDLTKLNQSVCRERHILPSVEQVLAQIGNAKVLFRAWCQFRVLANRAHPRISQTHHIYYSVWPFLF